MGPVLGHDVVCPLVLMWPLDPCSGLPLDIQTFSFFPVLLLRLFGVCFGSGIFLVYLENSGYQEIVAFNANRYVSSVLEQSRI